jgi:hypothetical protein
VSISTRAYRGGGHWDDDRDDPADALHGRHAETGSDDAGDPQQEADTTTGEHMYGRWHTEHTSWNATEDHDDAEAQGSQSLWEDRGGLGHRWDGLRHAQDDSGDVACPADTSAATGTSEAQQTAAQDSLGDEVTPASSDDQSDDTGEYHACADADHPEHVGTDGVEQSASEEHHDNTRDGPCDDHEEANQDDDTAAQQTADTNSTPCPEGHHHGSDGEAAWSDMLASWSDMSQWTDCTSAPSADDTQQPDMSELCADHTGEGAPTHEHHHVHLADTTTEVQCPTAVAHDNFAFL